MTGRECEGGRRRSVLHPPPAPPPEFIRKALAVKAFLARCGRMTDGDYAHSFWPGIPGEMARRVRAFDWAGTPLGPAAQWPEGLRAIVGLVLASPIVATIALLDERLLIYNDAAARLYGEHHPRALGQPLALAFPESYQAVAHLYDRVFDGETVVVRAQPLAVGTDAGDEVFDAYLTPVRAADGSVIGAHMIGFEIGAQLRADAALRASEERQAFLLALSDRLRPIARLEEIADTACRLVIDHLGGSRALYVDISGPAGEEIGEVRGEYVGAGAPMPSRFPLAPFGEPILTSLRAGQSLVLRDVDSDPRIAEEQRSAYHAVDALAGITIPLVKHGRWIAALAIHNRQPRDWTLRDVALTEQVAERTWAAVGRARAEAALREREADLVRVQRIGAVGGVKIEITDEMRSWRSPEYLLLHGLPPDSPSETHEDWRARVVPEDRASAERALFEALESDVPAYENEYRIVRPSDGAIRWIHARADIERAPDGKPVRLVGAHIDVTDQKRAQEALRQGEVRQAFILTLSDALQPLTNVVDIQAEATRVLGEHLGAVRVQYWEAELAGDYFRSEGGYAKDAPRLAGQVRASDFGAHIIDAMTAGRTVVVTDVATDPRITKRELAAYNAVGVRAYVGVPLVKYGRLVALLGVHRTDPQEWTTDEIALSEETAERTWFAIERARAEAALHESETRLQQFGEASQDILWIRDAETFQWEYLTPAFETIYGLDRAAALRGDNMTGWLELIVPEDRELAATNLARVRNGERVTFEYRIRRPVDGQIRCLRNTDFPIKNAAGEVVRIGGIGHDVTALKEAEQALATAESRQRTLIEGMPQLVWRAAGNGEWTWASPQWTEFTGQTGRESNGWGWLATLHPDDRQSARDAWAAAAERGSLEVDYRICQTGQGEYRWFHTRAAPVRDNAGAIIEWLGTSTDIDDLRSLQELQKTLLAELQHRVRNILAVIRSMTRRSSEGQESLGDYVQHLEGRIGAMARTQVLLTRAVDARVDLEDLIRDELVAQAAEDGAVTLAGPTAILSPKAAEVVSLAIHELTTNAIKYGALSRRSATLTIEWQIEDRAGVPWLKLVWSEAGVAIAGNAPRRQGFGTELILRRVPYELKGKGTFEIRPGGILSTLEFALNDRASILQTDARPSGVPAQT